MDYMSNYKSLFEITETIAYLTIDIAELTGEKMFTRLLYLNKDRVVEYNSLLSDDDYAELDEIEITKSSVFGADGKVVKGEKGTQRNYKGKIYASISRLWNAFYENLEQSEDYIDFVEKDSCIESVGRGLIIRIETEIMIPEAYDTFSILNIFPESIIQEQITSEIEDDDKDMVRSFFKMKKASLPICMKKEDGKLLCSRLYSNYFLCANEEFEESLDDDLVVVAKVLSPNKSKEKEIFNPLKDFIVLNRAARRSMDIKDSEGLENIYAGEDYMDLEILAIYQ